MESEGVTLGDKRVVLDVFERYKGVKDQSDVIAIISSRLVRGYRYYHPDKKVSFRAPTDEAELEKVKEVLGPPQQRFVMVVFHYTPSDYNDAGTPILDPTKCKGRVKLWSISDNRYAELSGIHSEWPLLDTSEEVPGGGFSVPQHDLVIKCTEEKFQRMQFTPTKTAHWKLKEEWYDKLKTREERAAEKGKGALGRVFSSQELSDLMGWSEGIAPGGTGNVDDIDLSDIAKGIDDIED